MTVKTLNRVERVKTGQSRVAGTWGTTKEFIAAWVEGTASQGRSGSERTAFRGLPFERRRRPPGEN